MSEAKVELVDAQRLSVDIPVIGATVTIRVEGKKIVVLVDLADMPNGETVDVCFDVETRRDDAVTPIPDPNLARVDDSRDFWPIAPIRAARTKRYF